MPATELPAPPEGRDRRDIVTPYAFQVHPKLLGMPLASPWRRLLAIGIDGLCVALLSEVPGGFLMLLASIVLFRWAAGWRGARRPLRWAAAIGGIVALWSLYGSAVDLFGDAHRLESKVGDAAAMAKLALDVEHQKCVDARCARPPLQQFGRFAGSEGWSDEKSIDAVKDLLAKLPVDDKQRDALRADYLKSVAAARKAAADRDDEPSGVAAGVAALHADAVDADDGTRRSMHSIIAWARGLLDDLGIGLGWAALYFTAFCSYWNGQTPGKRLLGIRVVQLDASPMTLWESFERYGGYGAGLATGLIGFLQVFWDPNRQAIHDKICETVVIRGDIPLDAPASPDAA